MMKFETHTHIIIRCDDHKKSGINALDKSALLNLVEEYLDRATYEINFSANNLGKS